MTCLRIEITNNFRGKLDMRIGDLEGCSTSSNLTKEEILADIKNELDNAFLFEISPETQTPQDKTQGEICKNCGKVKERHYGRLKCFCYENFYKDDDLFEPANASSVSEVQEKE